MDLRFRLTLHFCGSVLALLFGKKLVLLRHELSVLQIQTAVQVRTLILPANLSFYLGRQLHLFNFLVIQVFLNSFRLVL